MPTAQRLPAQESQPKTKTTLKGGGLEYEEPQPIGAPSDLNLPKDLLEPEGLPPKNRSEEIVEKDGFYLYPRVSGAVTDSLNGGGTATRYLARMTESYTVFFTARRPCEVMWLAQYNGGGTSGTIDVLKNSTTSVLSSPFTLSVANAQKQDIDLSPNKGARRLVNGDTLSLSPSGDISAMTFVNVTIYLKYLGQGEYQ